MQHLNLLNLFALISNQVCKNQDAWSRWVLYEDLEGQAEKIHRSGVYKTVYVYSMIAGVNLLSALTDPFPLSFSLTVCMYESFFSNSYKHSFICYMFHSADLLHPFPYPHFKSLQPPTQPFKSLVMTHSFTLVLMNMHLHLSYQIYRLCDWISALNKSKINSQIATMCSVCCRRIKISTEMFYAEEPLVTESLNWCIFQPKVLIHKQFFHSHLLARYEYTKNWTWFHGTSEVWQSGYLLCSFHIRQHCRLIYHERNALEPREKNRQSDRLLGTKMSVRICARVLSVCQFFITPEAPIAFLLAETWGWVL